MPLKDVAPKVVLKYGGVTVYNTYRHDMLEDPSSYIFTTSHEVSDRDVDCPLHFDIRDMVAELERSWVEDHILGINLESKNGIKEALRLGIDYGLIGYPELECSSYAP